MANDDIETSIQISSSDPPAAPTAQSLATLHNSKHHRARRHSLCHPTTLSFLPPSSSPSVSSDTTTIDKSPLPITSAKLSFESHTSLQLSQATKPIPDLSAQDLQSLLNRDVVVYSCVELDGIRTRDLWREGYGTWFWRRDRGLELDVSASSSSSLEGGKTDDGVDNGGKEGGEEEEGEEKGVRGWWGKYVMLESREREMAKEKGLEWSIERLTSVHEDLLSRIQDVLLQQKVEGMSATAREAKNGNLGESEGQQASDREKEGMWMQRVNPHEGPTEGKEKEWFQLQTTFSSCFLVLDSEHWEEDEKSQDEGGVLIVCKTQEIPKAIGLNLDEPKGEEGRWKYWRVGLKEAIKGIAGAESEDRKKERVGKSVFWEKTYGQNNLQD